MKLSITISLILLSVVTSAQNKDFLDSRDGQTYRIVKIDSLYWFSENLNFKSKNSVSFQDSIIKIGQWGRLYSKQDAMKVCPCGWRLPNLEDWNSIKKKKFSRY